MSKETMTIKIEIVGRETIKPFCPTPKHLRNFKLSLIDQTAPALYTPIFLFYSANDDNILHELQAAQRSWLLKTSLSKMLTQFYPLAGIIKDQTTIECTDEGAEYVEARVNCLLSDILQQPNASLRSFLPVEIESVEAANGRLLFVQAIFFECGGMVIAVSVSHKIADGSTLSTVIKSWAATALAGPSTSDIDAAVTAINAASFFPPVQDCPVTSVKLMINDCAVSTRYVFESKKIIDLKARAASVTVQQPTRVEVVTALIWKCMINVSRSMKGFPRLSLISHAVNLRKICLPPFPENSIGNIVGLFFSSHATEKEIDLQGLVCKLRKDLTEFKKTAVQTINVEKKTWLQMCGIENFAKRDDIDYCAFTSCCGFPFYEADFGWGKPTRAAFPDTFYNNFVAFMDTRERGIEAVVTLSKEEMISFNRELELLSA